jgi:hypothetical protein
MARTKAPIRFRLVAALAVGALVLAAITTVWVARFHCSLGEVRDAAAWRYYEPQVGESASGYWYNHATSEFRASTYDLVITGRAMEVSGNSGYPLCTPLPEGYWYNMATGECGRNDSDVAVAKTSLNAL